jgi:hypothetical protein
MWVHDCEQHRNRHGTRDACGNGFSRSPQCLVELSTHEQRQRFGTRCKCLFPSSSPHERGREIQDCVGVGESRRTKANRRCNAPLLELDLVPLCARLRCNQLLQVSDRVILAARAREQGSKRTVGVSEGRSQGQAGRLNAFWCAKLCIALLDHALVTCGIGESICVAWHAWRLTCT